MEWISVKERWPEGKRVLVTDGIEHSIFDLDEKTGEYHPSTVYDQYGSGLHMTHWMPLPEPPICLPEAASQ